MPFQVLLSTPLNLPPLVIKRPSLRPGSHNQYQRSPNAQPPRLCEFRFTAFLTRKARSKAPIQPLLFSAQNMDPAAGSSSPATACKRTASSLSMPLLVEYPQRERERYVSVYEPRPKATSPRVRGGGCVIRCTDPSLRPRFLRPDRGGAMGTRKPKKRAMRWYQEACERLPSSVVGNRLCFLHRCDSSAILNGEFVIG